MNPLAHVRVAIAAIVTIVVCSSALLLNSCEDPANYERRHIAAEAKARNWLDAHKLPHAVATCWGGSMAIWRCDVTAEGIPPFVLDCYSNGHECMLQPQ